MIAGADTRGDHLARLDEDELMGKGIPKYMQCDACSAVTWHVDRKLQRLQTGIGARQMKGYEMLEAMESVCAAKTGELVDAEGKAYDWGEYSIKTDPADSTKKLLAGPGCAIADQTGFGQYGGFRSRLMAKCEEVIGREAAEDIPAAFNVRWAKHLPLLSFGRLLSPRWTDTSQLCFAPRIPSCAGRTGCRAARSRKCIRDVEKLVVPGRVRTGESSEAEKAKTEGQEGQEEQEEQEGQRQDRTMTRDWHRLQSN